MPPTLTCLAAVAKRASCHSVSNEQSAMALPHSRTTAAGESLPIDHRPFRPHPRQQREARSPTPGSPKPNSASRAGVRRTGHTIPRRQPDAAQCDARPARPSPPRHPTGFQPVSPARRRFVTGGLLCAPLCPSFLCGLEVIARGSSPLPRLANQRGRAYQTRLPEAADRRRRRRKLGCSPRPLRAGDQLT